MSEIVEGLVGQTVKLPAPCILLKLAIPHRGVKLGNASLQLVNADGSDSQLFNLRDDPKESASVADQHPDIARRLQEKALAWRKSLPKLTPVVQPAPKAHAAVDTSRAKE